MKKFILLLCLMLSLLFTFGCTQQSVNPAPEISNTISSEPASSESIPEISQKTKDLYEEQIYTLLSDTTLFSNWEGVPVSPADPPVSTDFIMEAISQEDDVITVTALLYGNVFIDPVSQEETIGFGLVPIESEDESHAPQLAFGKSIVRFKESDSAVIPLSCSYEKYPHPGLDYLKAKTEKLQPVLSKSEKINVSMYDPLLVNYIWQTLFAHRYIDKPDDITLYDLENLTDGITFPFSHFYDPAIDMHSPDYHMDASLLKLMPNLESIECPYRLKDYSIFESMQSLKKLTLHYADKELFRTLKVGHTDELMLYDPDVDILDLTNINTETLALNSWFTAVRGFKGCDKIKKLYIMSTRTDMRLINSDTFPNVSYLNLYFYSDTPRVRDFSQLASFKDVKIDLYLDYQACNNQTLESLQNVKLNDLILNSENGTYPLPDFDPSLAQKLDTQNIMFGTQMYFQERTGD